MSALAFVASTKYPCISNDRPQRRCGIALVATNQWGFHMASYVLIVDDEEPIRRFLRRRLEGWGYTVKEAESATQALERMLSEPAAIAIIDITMPGRDGLWLAEQIRKRWSKTAIIMATGADDMRSVEESRQLGAVDYVLKPFDRELLRQALVRASEASSRGRSEV
jgi:DNA-binding NtrC family response regulator